MTIDLRDAQNTLTLGQSALRMFFDFDRRISHLFGLIPDGSSTTYAPATFILDERLRVIAVLPVHNPTQHVAEVMAQFDLLPQRSITLSPQTQAPVLMIPNVFEPELCQALIKRL